MYMLLVIAGIQYVVVYPDGYKSILRYYQSAKNVLTVGNARPSRELNGGSSKGPVADGRLKPEIVAIGSDVMSTNDNYQYALGSGTSMASPSAMGTLTLLNQRYRQVNNDDLPKGGLMKAIACNTADDLGNKGPDYAYGYGLINARRAVECIENVQYNSDLVSNGESKTFNITVPSGLEQVKVMLYWHDVEAPAYSEKALINDLDLKLTTPNGTDYLPWVLNPDTLHVTDVATRLIDTLNNIEQVTLDNPVAGNYTITINGSSIPTGPQEFFIVYDFISTELVLTYPYGEEGIEPGVAQLIQWDVDANNTSNFTLEYSDDGGASWDLIDANIDPEVRQYAWSVPNTSTEQGVIRISKNGTSNSDNNIVPFYILERPTNLQSNPICTGHLELTWNAIAEVDAYEVYTMDGAYMAAIDTVYVNSYQTGSLTVGEDYWYAIRGITSAGSTTERSVALRVTPQADGACPWNFDVNLLQIYTNQVGRASTFYFVIRIGIDLNRFEKFRNQYD